MSARNANTETPSARRRYYWSVGTGMRCLQHGTLLSEWQPTGNDILPALERGVREALMDLDSEVTMQIGTRPVCFCRRAS